MRYIFLLLVFCLSLGQLQRIDLLDGQINIYFHDIFLVVFVGLNFFKHFQDKKERIKFYKGIKPFLPLLVVGVLSLLWGFWDFTFWENFVGVAYYLRLLLLFIFFVQINQINKTDLWSYWNILFILVLIYSYLQYFLFPSFWSLIYLGWDPHMYRAVGTFFDPTIAGIIYIFIMYYFYFGYLQQRKTCYLIGMILCFPLIFLTYSRITYIAFIFSLLYYLFVTKNLRYFLFGIIGFVVVLFYLPRPEGAGVQLERVFSIKSRLIENSHAIRLFYKNPILGVGFNRIAYAKKSSGLPATGNAAFGFPSSFMTVLVSMGLIGVGAFIFMFWQLFLNFKVRERTMLVTLVTASIFENIFFVGFIFIIFALSTSRAHSGL